jgi:N-acylglucosamine 2-epimerase
METSIFHQYSRIYRDSLFNNILPFWETHARDPQHNGYFQGLDRLGAVYDHNKYIPLLASQAEAYATIAEDSTGHWLEQAEKILLFVSQYGKTPRQKWYACVSPKGEPIWQPESLAADYAVAKAFGAVGKAGRQAETLATFSEMANLLCQQPDHAFVPASGQMLQPTGMLQGALAKLTLLLQQQKLLGGMEIPLKQLAGRINEVFMDNPSQLPVAYASSAPYWANSPWARVFRPGESMQLACRLMETGEALHDTALTESGAQLAMRTMEIAWDKKYWGIFAQLDLLGLPQQQPEWDRKVWDTHLYALLAMAKAYQVQGRPLTLEWFEKIHAYCWNHFADPKASEWYGWLNRRGEAVLEAKGTHLKGCCILPLAFYKLWKIFETIEQTFPNPQAQM